MDDLAQRLARLSPRQLALLVSRMEERAEQAEQRLKEPIAVVGMSCRLPGGVANPTSYWSLLRFGQDGVASLPTTRWGIELPNVGAPTAPSLSTRAMGVVDGIDLFDPAFFGISAREASSMDPQQRLALEATWQALEDAGARADQICGPQTGVFFGVAELGYLQQQLTRRGMGAADLYFATGNNHSVVAGRVAYVLDARGPCVSVDTACSSGLAAVHLACQSLRAQECRLALAGAVHLHLSPEQTLSLDAAGMLSSRGACAAFDESADGFVRSEGVSVVVLKRLRDALADRDAVSAVISSSSLSQDGASTSLTAPNGPAQAELIRRALENADLSPNDVDYVEAHGTGTVLGDPMEAEALGNVFCRAHRYLALGSVKTNLGHTETCAGIAGLIKMVLAIRNEELPAHLHLNRLNPHLSPERATLTVPSHSVPWAAGPRRAGISSFGFSGTIAHVLVQPAPEPAEPAYPPPRPCVLPLSAKTSTALHALASRYSRWLASRPEVSLRDVCGSSATRTHYLHRCAVVADSCGQCCDKLRQLRPTVTDGVVIGTAVRDPTVAFLYGLDCATLPAVEELTRLASDYPAFASAFAELLCSVDPPLRSAAEAALARGTFGTDGQLGVDVGTVLAFVAPLALTELYRSLGVVPDAVTGCGLGEVVAACAAGLLDVGTGLAQTLAYVRVARSQVPTEVLAVSLGGCGLQLDDTQHLRVVAMSETLSAGEVVLAGTPSEISRAAQLFLQAGALGARRYLPPLSPLFGSALASFVESLELPASSASSVPLVSSTTGQTVDPGGFADYWGKRWSQPIRLSRVGTALRDAHGCNTFLACGWTPSCASSLRRQAMAAGHWVEGLGGALSGAGLYGQLAQLYVGGLTPDWSAVYGGGTYRRLSLPTYPFSRQSYWFSGAAAQSPSSSAGVYALDWQVQAGCSDYGVGSAQGRWLILGEGGGLSESIAAELRRLGGQCVVLGRSSVDGTVPTAGLHGAMDGQAYRGVVDCGCLQSEASASAEALLATSVANCSRLSRLVGLLSSGQLGQGSARLWVVTQGAIGVGEEALSLGQSSVWGLGRVASLEHPEQWGGMVDVSVADGRVASARGVVDALLGELSEDQRAYRRGVMYVPRLVRQPSYAGSSRFRCRAGGTYLVTGGLGGLGLRLAQWLVGCGARQLVLTSRRGVTSGHQRAVLSELRTQGAAVWVERADVSDLQAMQRVMSSVVSRGGRLSGVIHAAGVVGVEALTSLGDESFRTMFLPKVQGSYHLHALTRELPLEFFVLFSSGASVWGSTGQGHYGAANHFMDTLAHYRRQQGLRALVVNWGPWAEVGMASGAASAGSFSQIGIKPLSVGDGLEVLGHLLSGSLTQRVVNDFDWPVFRSVYESRRRRPMLSTIEEGSSEPSSASSAPSALVRQLRSASVSERRSILERRIGSLIGQVVGIDSGEVSTERPLMDLGVDSLLAVEVRNAVGELVGQKLPPTVVFDYPTVERLSDYVLGRVTSDEPGRVQAVVSRGIDPHEPIAIVGMDCRYPGGVSGVAQYYRFLRSGADATTDVPSSLWDWQQYYSASRDSAGTTYCHRGGFLAEVDAFAARFFEVSAVEARSMDPQHRLLLEVSWTSLEEAGIDARTLRQSRTGVFVGITATEYQSLLSGDASLSEGAFSVTGNTLNMASGRLSYVLGLEGPSVAIDTACSSSLVSVHMACQSLRSGECELALAGGVNVVLQPQAHIQLSRMGALSWDGRCKTFSATGDGYGRSGGCAMLVLKRLSDAQASSDRIWAVIRGSAVNQDGRTSSLTAPNGPSQRAVIEQALSRSELDRDSVGYIEAHGTGTPLGDPVEVGALGEVFSSAGQSRVAMGTVKTNIGHSESASGVAGLVKAVLSLRSAELLPHLHLGQLNPHIDYTTSPMCVSGHGSPWVSAPGERRVAGVSSFGFSGTNAHVVLQEGPAVAESSEPPCAGAALLCLSAKSAEELGRLSTRYGAYVQGHPGVRLSDVCFTANTGRSSFGHRQAVVVSEEGALRSALCGAAVGDGARVYRGTVPGSVRPRLVFYYGPSEAVVCGERLEGLCRQWPVLGESLGRCEQSLQRHFGGSYGQLFADSGRWVEQWWVGWALTLTAQWSVSELYRHWSVVSDVVLGVGVGELTAGCVSGALSIEQAIEVCAALGGGAGGEGLGLTGLPQQRWVSTVSGERVLGSLDGRHWSALAASSEASGLQSALGAVATDEAPMLWLEVGPTQSLSSLRRQAMAAGHWVEGLGGALSGAGLYGQLAQLYVGGLTPDWSAVYGGGTYRRLSLPTYPFSRQSYWVDPRPHAAEVDNPVNLRVAEHALLGRRTTSPLVSGLLFESLYSDQMEILSDHKLYDTVVVPGAAHMARVINAARQMGWSGTIVLEQVELLRPLVLPAGTQRRSQLILKRSDTESDSQSYLFEIHSADDRQEEQWTLHASGRLVLNPDVQPDVALKVPAAPSSTVDGESHYSQMWTEGYHLGPCYRWITEKWKESGSSSCRFRAPAAGDASDDLELPPGLLDSLFQLTHWDVEEMEVPIAVDRLVYQSRATDGSWGKCFPRGQRGKLDLSIVQPNGECILSVEGFRVRKAPHDALLRGVRPSLTDWLYEQVWDRLPSEPEVVETPPQRWVVVPDKLGISLEFVARMRARGDSCCVLDDATLLGPSGPEAALGSLEAEAPWDGLLYGSALDCHMADVSSVADLATHTEICCKGILALFSSFNMRVWAGRLPQVLLATRGVANDLDNGTRSEAGQASLWGIGRAAVLEMPELDCKLVDLDPACSVEEAAAVLLRESTNADAERQVAWRSGQRYGARLRRARLASAVTDESAIRADGTYLITGGLGGVGLELARWLASEGAGRVLLLSRRGLSDEAGRTLAEIDPSGERLHAVRVDVTRPADFRTFLRETSQQTPALRGVFHAAGVVQDGFLRDMAWRDFDQVLAPKAYGAWLLQRELDGQPIDFLVFFSSVTSLLGGAGQGNYAAANAVLDGLASRQQAAKPVVASINWGPIDVGMASRLDARLRLRWQRQGLSPIPRSRIGEVIAAILSAGRRRTAIVDLNWSMYSKEVARATSPYLQGLASGSTEVRDDAQKLALEEKLERVAPQRRRALLLDHVRRAISALLGVEVSAISPRTTFFDLGMDSLLAVELRNALRTSCGSMLPATLAFDYPTPDAITDYLAENAFSAVFDSSSTSEPVGSAQLAESEVLEVAEEDVADALDQELAALADEVGL